MDKDFHMIEEEEDAKMNCCLSSFQAHLTIAALATHICSFPFLTASRTSATDLRLWQSLTMEAPRQERAYLLHANWCLYFCDLLCCNHLPCPYVQAGADDGCVHSLVLTPLTQAWAVGATKLKFKLLLMVARVHLYPPPRSVPTKGVDAHGQRLSHDRRRGGRKNELLPILLSGTFDYRCTCYAHMLISFSHCFQDLCNRFAALAITDSGSAKARTSVPVACKLVLVLL